MIQIAGSQLSQWDVGRKVCVGDSKATHVHFANQGDSRAPIIKIENGEAKIPDYLLQTGKALNAYAVLDGVTLESRSFAVRKRARPENYVYEDDQRNYIYELISNAENAAKKANEAAEKLGTIVIPTKVSQLQNDSGYVTSVPDALPNPEKLTFEGAVSATYDGSSPVVVNIPKGGSGVHVGSEPPADLSVNVWIDPEGGDGDLDLPIPDALPNPHKLTFTGAVTGEYDGSQAVTVALPKTMVVTLTHSNGVYTADKTYAEISEAYEAGQEVRCNYQDMLLPLVQYSSFFVIFACVYGTNLYSVLIKATDNSVTMTVTDASASGSMDLSGYIPAPETAAVGQTVVVKAVDETGKPTQWEAVDLAGGSSADRPIELIRTVTIPADIATDTSGVIWSQSTGDTTKPYTWEVNTDESGETLNLKYFAIVYRCPNAAATSNSPFITIGFGTSQDGSQSSGLGISTADRRSGVFIWDGKLFIDSNLTSEWSSPTLLAPRIDSQNFATVGINSVDRIRLWFNSSSPYWPEGATFKIYGVRA